MDLFREAMKEYFSEKAATLLQQQNECKHEITETRDCQIICIEYGEFNKSIFSRSNIINDTVDSLVVVLHIVPKSIL